MKPEVIGFNDSCSLSDDSYGDENETELSNEKMIDQEPTEVKHVELEWAETQEIFAALDACNFESVGFREFCALVYLLAASQDNMLL